MAQRDAPIELLRRQVKVELLRAALRHPGSTAGTTPHKLIGLGAQATAGQADRLGDRSPLPRRHATSRIRDDALQLLAAAGRRSPSFDEVARVAALLARRR